MVPGLRELYNQQFTPALYQQFLKDLDNGYPGAIEFRVAETPVFVDKTFAAKMIDACESIIDVVLEPGFTELTERAIPDAERVPRETNHPHMIAFDFGVCLNDQGEAEPQLIEMQGFPSLYGFQVYMADSFKKNFVMPENYSPFLNGHTKESYIQVLKEVIVGDLNPENVILLEIKPDEQKTRIDFYCTRDYLGIQPVCITDLIQEGRELYYILNGQKTRILRIYNRVIFDDLQAQRAALGQFPDITQDLDVEWITHPNWFYRISKFTMPFIQHPYVPESYFLNELKQIPGNLGDFVLKPLFSFAGQGVVIDVTPEDIDAVKDPENWILQKKVKYADIIPTPDIPAKVEIRIMYLWEDGESRPQPAINLARLSKGKMIGVRYNKDKEWVGGTVSFFER
ncbi:circularly permuted type 2 ATP-grasp protein [Pseudoflavitalea sp. G-6-1-2]|uniref:hypothetical protein n=1 Tax=Pseudoflavitalea sp. G-6-1-2 TaxID=2728841 RepID=UPI001469CDBD|nr:hypothetical protein [Pseudoflavitalea sp. G-6-1-2]NML22147.1 circularly permuted type 2 ATP-grasp protein [Pseudoflavitalea sp. G-6-1-2]